MDNPIEGSYIDSDDAAPLNKTWFEKAKRHNGIKSKKVGRPRSSDPKRSVSIRLDSEVLNFFKNQGPGWQTRINKILRKHVES